MAGEREPDEDLPLEDEDAFILDDWDEELDIVSQVEAEVSQQIEIVEDDLAKQVGDDALDDASFTSDPLDAGDFAPGALPDFAGAAGPEDVLFTGASQETTDADSFDEHGSSDWEGADASPRELGLPISAGDEVQEFDLGQDDEEEISYAEDSGFFSDRAPAAPPPSLSQIQPGAVDDDEWTSVEQVAQDDEGFYAGESDGSEAMGGGYEPALKDLGAPADADWADDDDEYADDGFATNESADAEYADDGEVEYEEDAEYVDDDAQFANEPYYEGEENYVDAGAAAATGTIIGGRVGGRRGAGLRRVAATLAAVLVVGLVAATVVLKPEWLGIAAQPPMVDRTEVGRPKVDLRVDPPVAEFPPDPIEVVEGPDTPVVEPPVEQPVEQPEPPVAVGNPGTEPPTPPVPVAGNPPAVPPSVEPAEPGDPVVPANGLVAVGDELQVGSRVDAPTKAAPRLGNALAAGLVAGSQALVKLDNGNYFVGTVNKFDDVNLTLRVNHGEVVLAFANVTGLASLSEAEVKAIENRKNGFVQLRNRNRLFGSIEDLGLAESVVLSNGESRVIIPREEIEEIGKSRRDGVRVTDDLGDVWVRQLIERRLEQQRQVRIKTGNK